MQGSKRATNLRSLRIKYLYIWNFLYICGTILREHQHRGEYDEVFKLKFIAYVLDT